MQDTQTPATGLLRLGAAARIVGITPRAMAAALVDREIPISIVRLGNLHFVRAAELNQWLRAPAAEPAPDALDLF